MTEDVLLVGVLKAFFFVLIDLFESFLPLTWDLLLLNTIEFIFLDYENGLFSLKILSDKSSLFEGV